MGQPPHTDTGRVFAASIRSRASRTSRVRRAGGALTSSALLAALVASCTALPVAGTTSVRASAQDVCLELIDVGTLVFNMKNGFDAHRIPGEEYQGAMHLANSMLTRVGTSDNADVNSAVDELRSAAGSSAVDPSSEDWAIAFADVSESCATVLGEFGVRGWVGG